MSDTPRTDQMEQLAYWLDDDMTPPVCESRLVRQLERELNAANKRIKELEDVLQMAWSLLCNVNEGITPTPPSHQP